MTRRLAAFRAALGDYRQADEDLQANSLAEEAAGVAGETGEFHRLNDQAWATRDALAAALPRWLRWLAPR